MGGFRLAWLLLPFLAALVSAQDCLPYIQQKNVNLTWVGSDPPSCSACSAPNTQFFNNTKCSGDSDWNIGLNEFSVDLPPNSIVVQINAVGFANPTCAVGSSCTLGFLIQKTYLIVFDTPENASPDSCDLCTIQFTAQPPPTFCSGVSGFNYTGINDLRIFTTFNSLCISAAQLQIFYIQAVPQIASVFPTSIPVSTDEVIAITGSDFTPTANLNCYLNGKVYPTTFVDYKKITCTIPAFASTTNENFSLAIGNSSATLFTAQVLFYVVPTVASLSPDHASSHGIAAVYLTGTSFFDGDDMVCKFGTNKPVQAQYVNSTCVKCVNPLDSSCTASYVNVTFSPNGEDYINVPGEFYFTGCETPLPTPSPSASPAASTFPSQTPQPSPNPSPSAAPSSTAHNRIDLPDNFWYYFAIVMLLILIVIVFAISVVYMKRKKPPRRKPRAVLFDGTDESNTYGSTSSSGGGGGAGGAGGGNGHDSLTNLLLNDPNTVQMSELSAWREIEKGSFGVIYQATWRGTTIAVKKLPSKMIEREFHREAALMRSLRHPNVLQYLGTAVSKTEICILMEYMAQGSLYRLLHDPSSSFVHERMRSICIDTAKGMNYLHQQDPPIIHRDLKSHNLLVDEHWRVKVCDFGLSRFYQANATMTACGTPSWTAPEVLRNERYTTKADVYGFGVVVWEMLARRDPFPGMPPFQIVFAVGTQGLRPSIDEDWDPRWVQLLQNCWAEDPKKRPNFEQILSILESMRD